MRIEIAVQCHHFERRLCWMISSVLNSNADVGFSIAYIKGTGNPSVPEVAEIFKDKIDILTVPYDGIEEYQYRGWTRNRQLELTKADWIIFADSDMVYPPNFFIIMEDLLKGEFKDSSKCLYSSRFSTDFEPTEKLITSIVYPAVITDPWDKAKTLPGAMRANIGAGYFQLVNVAKLKARPDCWYNPPGVKLDYSWKKYSKCKSDKHFRKRLGGCKIPLPYQIHLNHVRERDLGHHIEDQR